MINQARALWSLSETEEAIELAREASELARNGSAALIGAWVLGGLASIAPDRETLDFALAEGERMISEGCVGHNQLWFYRQAAEACLRFEDWDGAEAHADNLERFTEAEPMLWNHFFCARARTLARWGRNDRSSETKQALESLSAEARQLGFLEPARVIDSALVGAT